MEILGIGPLEFAFIVLLALLILGPKDLVKIGRSLGQWLNKLVRSDLWKTTREASEKIRSLPTELMREAGMDELKKSLDAGVIPSVDNVPKPLSPAVTESQPPAPGDSSPIPGLPSDDPNKIAPPAPDPEGKK
jgi:Sec-independent protein translocase protein TatA